MGNTAHTTNTTMNFCTNCGHQCNQQNKFCGNCGQKSHQKTSNYSASSAKQNHKTKSLTQSNQYNNDVVILCNDIKLLVFRWCRKTGNRLNIDIPIPIVLIIASFCDIALLTFYGNSYLFNINPLNEIKSSYNVKKMDHREHATVIFGNSLKLNTFKWRNFNFVFRFRINNGNVNLMFVPSTFNQFTGIISKNDVARNNYKMYRFMPDYNYTYDEEIRVEIDMTKLCVYIENKSTNVRKKMELKGIDPNKIFCAFSMNNPFAEFEIIDQYWQRKKKLNSRYNKCKYDESNDDILMDNNIRNPNKIPVIKPQYDLSKIPPNRMDAGINYIGKCSNHIAICNRQFQDNVQPSLECFQGTIVCNQCNRSFEHQLILLHNCNYKIRYKIAGHYNNKAQTDKGCAWPDYKDIYQDVFQHRKCSAMVLSVSPIDW